MLHPYLKHNFQQFFIISRSKVFLNFELKICRWDKRLALSLASCSPAKILFCVCRQMLLYCQISVDLGGTIFLAYTIQKTIFKNKITPVRLSLDFKCQTRKRVLHFPITVIPEYSPLITVCPWVDILRW